MPLLLRGRGEGWTVEVFGKLPALPPFIRNIPDARLHSTGPVSTFEVYSRSADDLVQVDVSTQLEPVFFESVAYDIHFETNDGAEISLPPGAEPRRMRNGEQHYVMDFGCNVGWWDISVRARNGTATISAEIFSRKVDYREDYHAMREEVCGILRNLAMTANAKTYGLTSPTPSRYPTLNEWFALIKAHFSEFEKLAGNIARHPHSAIERALRQVDAQKSKRMSRAAIEKTLRRQQSGPVLPSIGVPISPRVDQQISSLTYDTQENRYFKGVLVATRKAIRALLAIKETGDEDGDKSSEAKFFTRIRPELREMGRRLDALLGAPFLKSVGMPTLARPASMVLYRHPVYSRFDKLARLLCGGLTFAAGCIPIGVKDTALLYEYWCFLKIVQVMRKRYDLTSQSIVKTNRFKTTTTLAKGRMSSLKFRHIPTGGALYLIYNRIFDRIPTVAQKPDNVIQLASENIMYVLDAKYRVQFDPKYVSQYGGPGPTADDINTMHRYRDAIVLPHPLRPNEYKTGVVIGAAVLFPFPDEEGYRQHRFYRSLDKVEIGGIPLLPGATRLFEEKLQKILSLECLPPATVRP